ncbi:CoA transferase [Gilvimarinus agarilyticus]|uniref:CaiB/BaiF CoA transferase family protein n=1 Tax=Gilvimarinus sp. 2_MG-2023 TaxID=3062666 RepID=UPI001C0A222B|nr:CaiB/BaiF CoA-transferase family protein [Gilvimarinus sp. 2_MG-2023]MBU2884663.1 CoA transferase [Gilvimarinus agarilyticus]MDO6569770.1 CaiB/BaiF CoA-transferase family protein [Gilvimarinus sp. 2_MG-2023]
MTTETNPPVHNKPLSGIRVIEFGQLIAGPFAGSLLAYFGAEVIKIEPPGKGDPIRGWRAVENGTSFWWHSIGRNKKSVSLDLRTEAGAKIARRLADTADVVIENFRPGVMESWGLGPESLKVDNPDLVYARISGYGQTGPYANKPGFASVCEGMSGLRYVNGHPGQAPVRPNLSIGDSIAGLHAAFGIVMALLGRERKLCQGQVVDVALYESIFNLMEAVVPEYSGAGIVREPSGTTVTGIVPTNTYLCRDGKYIVIGGNGDSIFKRLMCAIDREDMANDPALADNAGRVAQEPYIDSVLADWCQSIDSLAAVAQLEAARVPAGPIYNVADMFADEHYQARSMFERVEIDGKPLDIPAMAPKLEQTPGETLWSGPRVGEHTQSVLTETLGLSESELNDLRGQHIID